MGAGRSRFPVQMRRAEGSPGRGMVGRTGLRMRDAMMERLAELRFEPTEKRIRVLLGDHTVADTTRARLVWEPRRLVPSYAVPAEQVDAELIPDEETTTDGDRLLHPGIGFATHSNPGRSLAVPVCDARR